MECGVTTDAIDHGWLDCSYSSSSKSNYSSFSFDLETHKSIKQETLLADNNVSMRKDGKTTAIE